MMNTVATALRFSRRTDVFVCAAFSLCLAGCQNSAPPISRAPLPKSQAKTASAGDDANSRAISAWAKAFGQWAQGTSPSVAPSVPGAARKETVFVDVSTLARRHPAWRLADAIENNRAPRADWEPLSLPSRPLPRIALPAARAGNSINGANALAFVPEFAGRGGKTFPARALPLLQERSAELQNASLDAFLRAAASRQLGEREALGQTLQVALDEDIDASRRADLPALEPDLPARAIQLEMTNLRLQLLENARLSAVEKQAARVRLQALENRWRAMLRAQEDERARQLAQLREELPRRMRAEGQSRLTAWKETRAGQDTVALEAVRSAWSGRIAADFATREARLAIAFPADGAAPKFWRAASEGAKSSEARPFPATNSNQTFATNSASASGFSVAPSLQNGRAVEAARLRREAVGDAERWTRLLARRKGWTLMPKNQARDATAAALQMLQWR